MGLLFSSVYKKGIEILSVIIALMVIIGGYEFYIFEKYCLVPKSSIQSSPIVLEVKSGMTLRAIIYQLYEIKGVRRAPAFLFEAFARYAHQENHLKAGDYLLEPGITPKKLLAKMVSGEGIRYAFTIIEGWTTADLLHHLKQDPHLMHELKLETQLHPQSEGLFFPDTYYFAKGTSDLKFLNKASGTLQKQLDKEWANRDPNISLKTPYEALILASIIEKETGNAQERTRISSVFHARLKKQMCLQADPTVIYGASSYKGKITSAMLKQDTPYNTYVHTGLPAGPIALPGLASIRAALHPEPQPEGTEPYLYFVAKGDGTHYFSKTLSEHNQAVKTYILEKK